MPAAAVRAPQGKAGGPPPRPERGGITTRAPVPTAPSSTTPPAGAGEDAVGGAPSGPAPGRWVVRAAPRASSAWSTAPHRRSGDARSDSSLLLSISSNMPVIRPARSGRHREMAEQSRSPIKAFWAPGGVAARAAGVRGPTEEATPRCIGWSRTGEVRPLGDEPSARAAQRARPPTAAKPCCAPRPRGAAAAPDCAVRAPCPPLSLSLSLSVSSVSLSLSPLSLSLSLSLSLPPSVSLSLSLYLCFSSL